ncbi:MAG TPA: tRNA (N(6)-L-threonylcarbamoyladenosine(37)-C(2))-methylthiotransferase MtaB [Candidatus Kapabacteria bacterium]|nr:tRNA (N(6)-L-threonylcarbamoyladenosine(37)-C(2))-methylthiotransferase MtaB [Candidatus Kapabacteria bacterium]
MKIAAHTLGCKLNSAETSTIVEQFRAKQWEIVGNPSETDVYLLNTCSVTANAERECRQIVRRVLRENPDAFIAVTGCYAQLRPEEIASIEGVDVVLGAKEKFNIFENISNFKKFDAPKIFSSAIDEATDFHLAATSDTSERTRAFLKVQDGCDYTCTYCTIPMARGASRSTDIESILIEARRLSSDGFAEIILSGVNVGDYGVKSGSSFYELVQALEVDDKVTARIRISSIEPNLLTDEIIGLVASSKKFCPHFHIPLQSGSDTVLRAMQRRYNTAMYRERIAKVKSVMPHCGIGVDVIVGFPGETDEDFKTTYEFLNELDISYLHVFTYSERPDTKAATLGNRVPTEIRKERNAMLRILSEKKRMAFYRSQIGSPATALLEETEGGSLMPVIEGFTENYVRVSIARPLVNADAQLVRVSLDELTGETVSATPLEILSYTSTDPVLLPIIQ